MIISFQKGYYYIAPNGKVGSEVFHIAHGYAADLAYGRIRHNKHMGLEKLISDIQKSLHCEIDFSKMLGVMAIREPVDWLASWFNSRSRKGLAKRAPKRYTGNISFEQFIDEVLSETPPPRARLGMQSLALKSFIDRGLPFRLIATDIQGKQLRSMPSFFDKWAIDDMDSKRVNESKKRVSRKDLDSSYLKKIKLHFEDDYRAYEQAQETPVDEQLVKLKDDNYCESLQEKLQHWQEQASMKHLLFETLVLKYTSLFYHEKFDKASLVKEKLIHEFDSKEVEDVLMNQKRRYSLDI